MANTPQRRPTTKILGLLLLLMGAGSLLLALGNVPRPLEPAVEQTQTAFNAPETSQKAAAAIGPLLQVPDSATNPATNHEDWQEEVKQRGAEAEKFLREFAAKNRDVNGLPAWRWRSVDLDVDATGGFLGIPGTFKEIPANIAEILFLLANFLWQLVLMVLKLGFESDGLITAGAQSINTGAAFMADKLLLFAIPLGAIVAWRFVKEFVKLKVGLVTGAFRSIVVFVVSFGMVYVVVDRSNYAITNHAGDKEAQMEVPGTLPWAASQVLDLVDKMTTPLTAPVVGVTVGDGAAESADKTIAGEQGDLATRLGGGAETTGGPTTCAAYMEAIYRGYASGPKAERTLIVVSRLWESTFYESWKSAAFGEPVTYRSSSGAYASDIPERVMCHYAETVNDVPPEIQQQTARAAYGEAVPVYSGPSNIPAVFGPFDATNNKETRKAMTAWAACRWTGSGWVGQTEFDGARADDGSENPYDNLCSGVLQGTSELDDAFYVFGGDVKDATSRGDAAHREQLKAARSYGLAYSGGNAAGRIVSGALAIIVAIAFILTFGFLGLGLMIAMMLAVVFLALALPVALVLAAIGRTRQAQPLFKMTLMSLMSHGLLTVILSAIIIVSGIFRALLTNFDEMPLLIRSLTNGLAPVAAFFAVRAVMKSVGMADILTPTGALSFAGAAALKQGGGAFAGAGASMASGAALKKAPGIGKKLEKLDRYAPNYKNWSRTGRAERAAAIKKEDAATEAFYGERIAARKPGKNGQLSRWARMRNAVDRAHMPGSVRGKLGEMLDSRTGRLGNTGVKHGLRGAALAGLLAGPAGWAVLGVGAAGAAGSVLWSKWRARRAGRAPGGAVDVDLDALAQQRYSKKEREHGREVGAHRHETIRRTGHELDKVGRHAADELARTNPGSTDVERSQEAMRAGVAHLFAIWARELTGSSELRTPEERDALRVLAGKEEGYPATEMLTSSGGVVINTPYSGERKRKELNPEQLTHFTHWLPEEDKVRQRVTVDGVNRFESESEYASRLLATGIARGVCTPEGKPLDVLKMAGIDINTKEGKKEVKDWQNGKPNAILDNLRIVEVDGQTESRIVTAALEVARQQDQKVVVRIENEEKELMLNMVNEGIAKFEEQRAYNEAKLEAIREGRPLDSVPNPSAASREAHELKSTTEQLLVAVKAAKDLFEGARASGNTDAINKAAQRMSLTMEKLEASQEKLVDRLGTSLAESLNKQLTAQELRDEKFAQTFERAFTDGVGSIENVLKGVSDALNEFKQGTLSLQEVIGVLNAAMTTEKKTSEDAAERLQGVLADLERSAKSSTSRTGPVTWGPPSARDVAEASGAHPIPRKDDGGR